MNSKTRLVSITNSVNDIDTQIINVKFPKSSVTKYLIHKIGLDSLNTVISDTEYEFLLTEINIEKLYDLKKQGFKFCNKFIEYYTIITSWNIDEYYNQFLYENIEDKSYIKENFDNNILLIEDKKIKYQYNTSYVQPNDNLESLLAFRESSNCWISSKLYTIKDVIVALQKLNRNKILFSFDAHNIKNVEKQLNTLSNTLDELNIIDKIGIYFRLSNSVSNNFNSTISEKKYNCKLDNETKIVGVENNKLPKFLLNTNWLPDAIISLETSFIGGKLSAYSNQCDMIIMYTDCEPLIQKRNFTI